MESHCSCRRKPMTSKLEEDLRRVLQLARAEARAHKANNGKALPIRLQRHRHDKHLTAGRHCSLVTAKMEGLAAIHDLDTRVRHWSDCSTKSVLYHCKQHVENDHEMLQERLDARRTVYKRHFAGAMSDSSGQKRELSHVLEAASRQARASRSMGLGIGAAILTESHTLYAASAVENGALTLCAERAAVVKMVTSDANTRAPAIVAMAICSEQQAMLPFPCGACRELLASCGDFPVYLVNALGETEKTRSSVLFPRARHSELTQLVVDSQSTKTAALAAQTQSFVPTHEPPLQVKEWTTEHVLRWLEEDVQLPQYRDVFERNNVDGCTLVLLEGSDLQLLLGITHPLHRSKLLTHVDRLRDRDLLARGLDYSQLEDYLAVLDTDRVSAVAQLKSTFDRLDANHDGFLDFSQVKQALSRLRCSLPAPSSTGLQPLELSSSSLEASPRAVERLLHSKELFGKEAASSGNVSFPAFARAFSKLAMQPAETPAIAQGAFTLHAVGPRLPILNMSDLQTSFKQQADQTSCLDEPGLVRLLKELGQSDAQSSNLACRWMDAQDDKEDDTETMTFAQFIARYAQLVDTNETTGVARLQQLFTSFEPVHSTRRKPRTVVQRALSTLFPAVPSDEVSVWCATFWPPKVAKMKDVDVEHVSSRKNQTTSTLTFPEFTLACLEFAAEVYAREQEVAFIKRSLRNDALVHRSRVVHLHSSGHVRMCPQPPDDKTQRHKSQDTAETRTMAKATVESKPRRHVPCSDDDDDGKHTDREAKDSDDDAKARHRQRRERRAQQVDETFDRFVGRHCRKTQDNDAKEKSDEDDDPSCTLNAVEAAQAALELGAALSREQVLRFLEREGLGRIRRRDISRTAFHRLMKRLDANQSHPRDLFVGLDNNSSQHHDVSPSLCKEQVIRKSPRCRAWKSKPDYDEFLKQKLARSNGTQWEKEVDALRRKHQRKEKRWTSKDRSKRSLPRSRHVKRKHDSDDDGKHHSDSDCSSYASSESSTTSRSVPRRRRRRASRDQRRSQHGHKRRSRRRHQTCSSSSEASTETDTISTARTRRRAFEPGARVANMVHGRGTIERVYRDYFVADVYFDSGHHFRNVDLSSLRVLDPEDELLREMAKRTDLSVGSRVSVAHKGTKTRRQGKIILCRTDGTFDVLVNEFGEAQTLKRLARSALAFANVRPTVYRNGALVMVKQRTEYLRGKICACRSDGSYDVKLARPPHQTIQRLAPEHLARDDDDDDDDNAIEESKESPITTRASNRPKQDDSDDNVELKFSRGDRVEARFGGQASFYPGTIERVHPNGTCDISYDDGDEEEHVVPRFIRALSAKAAPSSRKTPAHGYESDSFESD